MGAIALAALALVIPLRIGIQGLLRGEDGFVIRPGEPAAQLALLFSGCWVTYAVVPLIAKRRMDERIGRWHFVASALPAAALAMLLAYATFSHMGGTGGPGLTELALAWRPLVLAVLAAQVLLLVNVVLTLRAAGAAR